MKTLQIKTAQNVNIKFTAANVFQRLLAFSVDNVIKFAYFYFAAKLFDFNLIDDTFRGDGWTIKAMEVLFLLPITFYTLYSEILMDGQTLGKRLLKIKVINIDGFKPSITDYIIRWFLRIVDFNLFILLFIYAASLGLGDQAGLLVSLFFFGKLVGFLLILFTKNSQRFGDIIANTIVIYLKDDVAFSETILENIKANYVPTYANVIKLSDNDARIIKETYKTAIKTNDFKTLIKLRSKILEVTDIKSVHKSDSEFIDTILKDYNYYTQNM
ncbi:RDD family protein [Polaribacter reichenbachii]|uniref:Transporter n=1 Tax=Polaribacter reichenbachii TaxID=996801 RepID=A0A1B8U1G8_9FLAO|nr:RDD family protein [Polaribacter reichenbachii]APZ47316.1 RDD family protein [Polaribacter reichenbachii]AUC17957.1 RDD family protein [Polaribacter reichenbachii]OBY65718.1 transporter [Polaribacter reichenbachii]